jgi:hypothetical protein
MYPSTEPVQNSGGKATAPKPVCENPRCGTNNKASTVLKLIAAISERAKTDPSVTMHGINDACPIDACNYNTNLVSSSRGASHVVHIDQRTPEQRDPEHRSYTPTPLLSHHVF